LPVFLLKSLRSNYAIQDGTGSFSEQCIPIVYNKYRTVGVEVEAEYAFAKHFNVRGVLTLQKSKALDFHTWLAKGFRG
jgi:hypothetical protein